MEIIKIDPWEKSIKPVGVRIIFWTDNGEVIFYKDFRYYRTAKLFAIRQYLEGVCSPRQSIYWIIGFKVKEIREEFYSSSLSWRCKRKR